MMFVSAQSYRKSLWQKIVSKIHVLKSGGIAGQAQLITRVLELSSAIFLCSMRTNRGRPGRDCARCVHDFGELSELTHWKDWGERRGAV